LSPSRPIQDDVDWATYTGDSLVNTASIEELEAIGQTQAARETGHDQRAIRHSQRFRKVSNRYPRRVAEAYGLDLERAAADSDEQVAATVADWERAHGVEPRDWLAIGRDERDEQEEAA
jgi:hypothetical protein